MLPDANQSALFARICPLVTKEEQNRLLSTCRVRTFRVRDVLIEQDSNVPIVLMILEGVVSVSRRGPAGRSLVFGQAFAGDFLGEVALFLNTPHSVSGIAEQGGIALEWDRTVFMNLLAEIPSFTRHVMGCLSRIIIRADEQRLSIVEKDLPSRVFEFLTERSRKLPSGQSVVSPKIRNTEIARSLGVSREGVVRAIGLLKQSGEILVSREQIQLNARQKRS